MIVEILILCIAFCAVGLVLLIPILLMVVSTGVLDNILNYEDDVMKPVRKTTLWSADRKTKTGIHIEVSRAGVGSKSSGVTLFTNMSYEFWTNIYVGCDIMFDHYPNVDSFNVAVNSAISKCGNAADELVAYDKELYDWNNRPRPSAVQLAQQEHYGLIPNDGEPHPPLLPEGCVHGSRRVGREWSGGPD